MRDQSTNTVDILHTAIEHLRSTYSAAFLGTCEFWTKGLIAFVFISSVFWLIAQRHNQSRSIRELLRYWFPRELYTHPTARITHWHYVLQFILWGPLLALVTIDSFKFALGVHGLLETHLGHRAPISSEWAIISVQTSTAILSLSFAAYWAHYAAHKIPFLWSFHRSHHSVEALTLPALMRTHPVDSLWLGFAAAFSGFVVGLALYVTGTDKVHPTVIAILAGYGVFELITAIFQHAHVPVGFGWLNRIFYGPVLHQIHHSAEVRHRDKNLGNALRLSIWDWMFGTLYLPEKGEQYRWGLNDEEYGPSNPHLTLREYYLEPFRHARSVLRKRRHAIPPSGHAS